MDVIPSRQWHRCEREHLFETKSGRIGKHALVACFHISCSYQEQNNLILIYQVELETTPATTRAWFSQDLEMSRLKHRVSSHIRPFKPSTVQVKTPGRKTNFTRLETARLTPHKNILTVAHPGDTSNLTCFLFPFPVKIIQHQVCFPHM